jgi:dihydroorotate dehydrogenase
MSKYGLGLLGLLSLVGLVDASYLTYEHYTQSIPPCSANVLFADCGKVLASSYATIGSISVALIGLVYYFILFVLFLLTLRSADKKPFFLILIQSFFGLLASLYFVYLQIWVIGALCFYCLVSATASILIFVLAWSIWSYERKLLMISLMGKLYAGWLKPMFFRFDPEFIHTRLVDFGEILGQTPAKNMINWAFNYQFPSLKQEIAGITFASPIGLAAGFDYNGKLTQILPSWGFGFQTIGTITAHPSEGNPLPRLGRLPKSKSLMVNKGFRNPGSLAIVNKLHHYHFRIPLGISVGRTNSPALNNIDDAITDIVKAFRTIHTGGIDNAYYELNISCPNLKGNANFYDPDSLRRLFEEVKTLNLNKPIFVKMPIEKSDAEVLAMLDVIAHSHLIEGVIIGNLQKNRLDPAFDQDELSKFLVGNFSGKPTFNRSNELIELAFQHYGDRLVIIGCGGVFSAEDAYKKITLGASLVQLITGMIFVGPQLIMNINTRLEEFLERDGFTNIYQAIGSKNNR